MPTDHDFDDDPILSRIARARPPLPDDLSPSGQRAAAIAERVLATPRPSRTLPTGRRSRRSRRGWTGWRGRPPALLGTGGLAVAAACAVVVLIFTGAFTGRSPAPALAAVIHIQIKSSQLSAKQSAAFDSTLLGRTIHAQTGIQENIRTGTAAQNRAAITALAANRLACERAAMTVAAVPVPATGLQHTVQQFWVTGIRLQAVGDQQLIAALRAYDAGHRTAGKRQLDAAGNTLDADDVLTGWSELALYAPPPDPKPQLPHLAPVAQWVINASGLNLRRSRVR